MKKLLVLLLLIFPVLAHTQTVWTPVTYNVSFKIKNAGVTVSGKFIGLVSDLKFSPDKLESSHLKASVEATSIKTGIDMRDNDLQDEKYFYTEKYKLIEIASVKLYKKGAQYTGLFDITIKGVTKQMEIPFEFEQTGSNAEFKGSFTINRRDFGVGGRTLTMSEEANVSILITVKS